MSTNVDTADERSMAIPTSQAPDLDAFSDMVEHALEKLPATMVRGLDNVVFLVEDTPPINEDPGILGIYRGIPLTERGSSISGELPDTITLYRLPHLQKVPHLDDLAEEIRTTLIHEIGHYYGLDEQRLHELGWG